MVTKTVKTKVTGVASKLWNQLKSSFREFCEKTSVHAVRYLTGDDTSIFKKIFFAIVTICALTFCCYLVQLQVYEYEEKSIITTITTTAYPVWKVPFPAVIICNFNIVMKQNADVLVDMMKAYNIKESIFDDITSNLSSLITTDELGNISEYAQVYELLQNIHSTDRMMSKLAQPCERMLKECYWKSTYLPCKQLFRKVKTTQGFCCAFNHYGTFDISDLVAREPINNSYYVGGAGPALGLRVVVDLEEDQYKSSIKPVYGFNVVVQPSIDFPDMHLTSYSMEASEELTLSVTPKLYVSAKSIKSVNLRRRQCLFDDEGTLEWTNVYNYKTCTSECKARSIYQYCKCWPYYYPLLKPLRICSLLDVPCLRTYKYNYSTMNDDPEDDEELSSADKCNCYPQCNEVEYILHSDRAKATPMQDYFSTNYSILNVYFDTVGCHKTEKDVYNTWDRALSSVGGIVGFCIGGSIITVVEIIFFFCQTILFTWRKKTKKIEIRTISQENNFTHYIRNPMVKPLKN